MNNLAGIKRILSATLKGIAGALLLIACIALAGCSQRGKVMKFSIDDASLILQDVASHDYDSVFDSPYLSALKNIHDRYDLDVTIFVYENTDSFKIEDFPDKYKRELSENSDWLKFGWHGIDEHDPTEEGYTAEDLIASYMRTTDEIRRFAGKRAVSRELRLHFWYCGSSDMVNLLRENGVSGLYYPDSDVIGYDFDEEEDTRIRSDSDGILVKKYKGGKVKYQRTDLRLDNISDSDELLQKLNEHKDDKTLVVFTHAWMLSDTEKYLEPLCSWATDNDFKMDWN